MTRSVFCRYSLRTTDPDAARAFYSEVVGLNLPPGGSEDASLLEVWLLHERARSRGAPAHWLGHIGVTDVEATVARLVEHGSERLGPTVVTNDGTAYATFRDPFGAVVAVRASAQAPAHLPVTWHQLHTTDLDRAWAIYAELFGWKHTETLDVADPVGGHRIFAWGDTDRGADGDAEKSVGSMANTARWQGVHAHWLYHFAVADLDASLAKARAHGGRVLSPIALPNGDRLAACEDPQGAAFGLIQVASRP